MWDAKYWYVVYWTVPSSFRSRLFFPTFRCISLSQLAWASSLLHSSTGQTHLLLTRPANSGCDAGRIYPSQCKCATAHRDQHLRGMRSPTRQDTPQESFLIGREGREEKCSWSQFGSDLSQHVFINLHPHPNENVRPMPAKHNADTHVCMYVCMYECMYVCMYVFIDVGF